MLKKYLTAGTLLFSTVIFGQNKSCGTMDNLQEKLLNNPSLQIEYQQMINDMKMRELAGNSGSRALTDIVYIPVVFHVIYNSSPTEAANISDAQILSQIESLNKDYTFTNENAGTIPTAFLPAVGKTKIQFCLAKYDQNGAPTSGIERLAMGQASWDRTAIEQSLKPSTTWGKQKYLNIWTCVFGGTLSTDGVLAYAQFPSNQGANTDGVIARYNVVGTTGVLTAGYAKGKTLAHEIGHWLGLFHIWGDDNGACTGSDNIQDTPNQAAENYGCPTYPHLDSCNTTNPGVMFMNYMDYTGDACMGMFTNGQVAEMENTISNRRSSLMTAVSKCFYSRDAKMLELINPAGSLCSSEISPIIKIKNIGLTAISSGTVLADIDGTSQTLNWSGNVPPLGTAMIALPNFSGISNGSHTIKVVFNNVNGSGADNDITNDSIIKNFVVNDLGNGTSSLPFSEDFENNFPPSNWDVMNPNNDAVAWVQSTTVGGYGSSSNSMVLYNAAYSAFPNKKKDQVQSPIYDFTTISSPSMRFDYAYAIRDMKYDSLSVSYSLNCGNTWNTAWVDGGNTLKTSTNTTTVPFAPTSGEWKSANIDLSFLKNQKNVQVRFENMSGWGNAVYVDNINIGQNPNGIEPLTNQKLPIQLLPNPANELLAVRVPADHIFEQLDIYNVLGEKVISMPMSQLVTLISLENLQTGSYLIRFTSKTSSQTEKFMVVK